MRPRPPPTKLGMQTPRQQPRGRHAVRYRTTAASPLSPVGRGLLCNVGSMGGKGWRKMARPRCCVTVTGKHGKQKQTVTSTRSRRQEEGGAETEQRQRQRQRRPVMATRWTIPRRRLAAQPREPHHHQPLPLPSPLTRTSTALLVLHVAGAKAPRAPF
jgi:hypothetical protein